ncbi:nucleotide sugar dehydrogenase [Litoreibacter janthinus]|uniref:UDP-glucose 6-dehydrogenase n=1 Tax=Litoreibacter janthinus TaxID=670154 RepID=A0A1I6FV68_9RHOB|nr:nucleotide sugar dehydrogenase [Litoreibacter janthinus]SFR33830.1 GDP-mannose 6-dehydrogenase [Litoreibacter janthinus]
MKVLVFGLGYVGLTAGCCIASEGHQVVGIDVSAAKVKDIAAGNSPIHEPGLQQLMEAALADGTLSVTTDVADHLKDADLALVCVGTPSSVDGALNMSYVAGVSRQIASGLAAVGKGRSEKLTVAYRSTVQPGTTDRLIRPIFDELLDGTSDEVVQLVYNPEFLREGSAIKDYFHPPKIVVGTVDAKPNPQMEELNANIDARTFWVNFPAAEITKLVDNSWHATKVAFANEIGRTCLSVGIDAKQVHEVFVSDTKLNISPYYTRPGGAFGGSCLPKDVRALRALGSEMGTNLHLVDSLLRSNEAHKFAIFQHCIEGLPAGAGVLLVGLAFKAETDDLRESPNVDLARKLLEAGYKVDIFDPCVDAEMLIGSNLGYAYSQLPMLERLLVDKKTANEKSYDRVIATNATISHLSLPASANLIDISAL